MRLRLISDATIKYSGDLYNYFGTGKPWSINLGTSDKSRDPLLYIKVPLSFIRPWIRLVRSRAIIWADRDARSGHIYLADKGDDLKAIASSILRNNDVELYVRPRLHHPGETHITIAMWSELSEALDGNISKLKEITIDGENLFDIVAEVDIKSPPLKVFRAGYYKDEVDPAGPLLVALNINCPTYYKVRSALGMEDTPWIPHITIGYVLQRDEINRSYLSASDLLVSL